MKPTLGSKNTLLRAGITDALLLVSIYVRVLGALCPKQNSVFPAESRNCPLDGFGLGIRCGLNIGNGRTLSIGCANCLVPSVV